MMRVIWTVMMIWTVMKCPPKPGISAVPTAQPSFHLWVNLRGTHLIYIYTPTEQLLLSIPFFRHCQLAHRNKVEQKCNFCGEKLENFPALVDHHLKEHPSQIKTLLQGKKKRKYARKPLTRRRTSYEDELNRRGVVNVRTAFKGDIVITRLQNPAPQDTDISVLFLHLRAQIKEIFRKFYAQKASFRWLIIFCK